MKNIFYKIPYSLFSFLADKTKGWKIFVNPKLFFGALIVGVTALSVNSCQAPEPTCYDPVPEVMCYDAGPS